MPRSCARSDLCRSSRGARRSGSAYARTDFIQPAPWRVELETSRPNRLPVSDSREPVAHFGSSFNEAAPQASTTTSRPFLPRSLTREEFAFRLHNRATFSPRSRRRRPARAGVDSACRALGNELMKKGEAAPSRAAGHQHEPPPTSTRRQCLQGRPFETYRSLYVSERRLSACRRGKAF